MGGAYYSWGNKTPQSARDVAAALKAGKPCKRTNCHTNGYEYYLVDTCIARLDEVGMKTDRVARELRGERQLNYGPLGYSFGGWPTTMTARHLSALGIRAEVIKRRGRIIALMNGKAVDCAKYYTLDDLAALPKWEPPKPPVREPKFINLTVPLFV